MKMKRITRALHGADIGIGDWIKRRTPKRQSLKAGEKKQIFLIRGMRS